jgi:type II secretory pathway pseudopilin PulG
VMAIVIAIAVPGWLRARSTGRMRACQENLSKIDGAKEQWALETNAQPGATPTEAELSNGNNNIIKNALVEPSGFDYVINPLGVDPTCTSGLPGHSVAEIGISPMLADESSLGGGS